MKIIKYFGEAIIIYIFFLIIILIGLNNSRKLFSFIFLKIGPFIKSKKIVEKNIYRVFGNSVDKKKIITDMWSNYGKTFVEYLYLRKFKNNLFNKKHISIDGSEKLDEIVKSNRPVIFVSGHFANFELMSMELTKKKIKLATIYRPLNNIFLNPLMEYLRMKYICPIQIPKGISGSREIVKKIKDGYSIALMVDQRVSEGPRISFFNKEAHTTTIPVQIALKYNCKLVPIYIERKNGINFEMVIHKPYEITKTGIHEEDLKNNSLTINQNIEKMIIKNPTQWIWTHDRWK